MALGASEVGRVSVRVIPDVEDFRRETKAKLESEVAGLEIEIPITASATGLRQEIQRAVAAASQGINAKVGIDVDNINAALIGALRANRPDVDVTPRVDEAEIRRVSEQISRSLQRNARRGGTFRGGNPLIRAFTQFIPLIQEVGTRSTDLVRTFRANFREMRRGVEDLGESLDRTADRIRNAQNSLNGGGSTTLRNNMRDTVSSAEAIRRSTAGIGDSVDYAAQALENFRRRAQNVRDADTDIIIRPRVDETALTRFRRELQEAFDRIRRPVDAGRIIDTSEGDRELSVFEAAVLRVARRVREITVAIRDSIRQSSLLRGVFRSVATAVLGLPGSISRFAQAVGGVRTNWERLQVLFLRSAITIDDLGRRAAAFGRTSFNRAWLELGAAVEVARRGIDRFFVSVNRGFIELDNGVRRTQTAFDNLGTRIGVGINRGLLVVDEGIRRIGDGVTRLRVAFDGISDRLFVGLNRGLVAIDNGFRRVDTVIRSIPDGVTRISARVYDLANTLRDPEAIIRRWGTALQDVAARVRDVGAHWYDVRRATLLASDAVTDYVRRNATIQNTTDRIRDGWNAVGNAIRNINFSNIYQGFIRAGDQAVVFSRRVRQSVTESGGIFRSFGNLVRGVFTGVGDDGDGLGTRLRGMFSNIGTGLATLFRGIGTQVVGLLGTFASLAGVVGIFGAIAAAVTVVGAAVAGVISTVSTVIATLPGLILLIAGPVAAVMAGLDGIKAAAATIAPEFEALKASVSATFEAGLIPVFRQLADQVFPTLQTGLNLIATELVGVAANLTNVVSSGQGLALLEATFRNIANAVRELSPVFEDLLLVILEMGAIEQMFSVLTGFLRTFVSEWRNSIAELQATDTLTAAFTGLEALLGSVATAFTHLIENGIRAFASAAPGMTAGLDSLTAFFDRFDWDRLGTAIGDVFQGMGEALDAVDPGTIEAITAAFERLGDTFRDPNIQQMFTNMVAGIPIVLEAFDSLIAGFGRIGSAFTGFVSIGSGLVGIFSGIALAIKTSMEIISNPFDAVNLSRGFEEAGNMIRTGGQRIVDGIGFIGDAFRDRSAEVNTQIQTFGNNASKSVGAAMDQIAESSSSKAGVVLQKTSAALATGFKTLGTEVTAGVAPIPPLVGAGLEPIGPTAQGAITGLGPVVQSSFAGLGAPAVAGLEQVNSQVIAGVSVWALSMQLGFQRVVTAAQTGFLPVQTAVVTGLTAINSQIIAAVSIWALSVQLGFANIATAAAAGWATVTAAATVGLTAVNSAIIAGVSVWALSVQLGFANVALAAQTGFVAVQTAATAGLVAVNAAIIAGVAVWALSVQLGMQAMSLAATTGWTLVATAATAGLTLVNATIIAGVAVWGLSIQLGMQAVILAITTSFLLVNTAVLTSMTLVNATIIAGLLVWAMSFTIGFTAINAAVLAGFALMVATVTAGMTQINAVIIAGAAVWVMTIQIAIQTMVAALQAGITQMVAAVTDGMAQMNAAIQAGMAQANATVQAGVATMVATLNAAVPQFFAAGSNMGAALADGLNSQVGAVQAAAANLANAAAAATAAAAQIASPSKVFTRLGEFTGDGYVQGLLNSVRPIVAAIKRVFSAVETASGTGIGLKVTPEVETPDIGRLGNIGATVTEVVESDDFGRGIHDEIVQAMSDWELRMDASAVTKLVNKKNIERRARG